MLEVQQLGNYILEIEEIGERLLTGYSSYCNACYCNSPSAPHHTYPCAYPHK